MHDDGIGCRKAGIACSRVYGVCSGSCTNEEPIENTVDDHVDINPVVLIKSGKIQGAVKYLLNGSKYYSFKGIPYAQPPVGKLRFKDPLPLKTWDGVFNAMDHGKVCPQNIFLSSNIIEGSENCLFLNVYTQSLLPDSKLPVFFYIHGGAFISGSGDTDMHGPEFLLQHDVVLVTINYRLEAFGFLCLDIPEVPGNAGLKDQVAALHWVKNNVSQFGGDPENITIWGGSAGGASVTYHMISPMTKGLFHKAISQSGTFLSEWTNQTDGKERAFKVGKYLGKDTDDPYELLEFLQSVPAYKLIGMSRKLETHLEKLMALPTHFTPVIEKEFPNTEAFITDKPINLLISKKVHDVPHIAGYCSAEGLLVAKRELKNLNVKNTLPFYFLTKELFDIESKDKVVEFGNRIKKFYFDNKHLTSNDIETIGHLFTDPHMLYGIHKYAFYCAEACKSFYMYRFNLDTDLNIMKQKIGYGTKTGACHGDDLFYFFKNHLNSDKYQNQQKLKEHVNMLTKIWTNFAKTGNPTPDNRWNIIWKPYTRSSKEYLRIDNTLSMGKGDDEERINFWNELYAEAGLHYYKA
ncbi:unnamed protein product [Euphydryas editha]|uniref:Carboxylic ester hydrolase n=1 Tax=Euphydryas editha TaxID=104508 RepID=A0AAU9V910_EUPED|nr:unnamed protein product [Euphydryas editha]